MGERDLLTQDEARKKTCFRAPYFLSNAFWPQCIASECMAWRFCETGEFNSQANAEFRQTGRRQQSDTGYCGLAGHPSAES